MINTLYLPELREMLAENDSDGLRDFCEALNPVRAAEFMSGLSCSETWQVLQQTDLKARVDIFLSLDKDKQHEVLETCSVEEVGVLVAEMPPDDRVDLLQDIDEERRDSLLAIIPIKERRDFQRLSQYPEETAGAVMTTEIARLAEDLTTHEALNEIARQIEEYETIYYLYVVDEENRLRGIVSARQLMAGMRKPDTRLKEIMESDLVVAHVDEDQEDVANKVAKMDLLAIPVVDKQHKLLGIITHDDVIDVVREEATEDAHRIGAVDPLDESYLRTSLLTLSWKRGIWLAFLFFFALITTIALDSYEGVMDQWKWLMAFIPLVISSGGNSGSQSATLIITALSRKHIEVSDLKKVVVRELAVGLLLGGALALMGLIASIFIMPAGLVWTAFLIIPLTLLAVVICGTLTGSVLPITFERLGWDPAIMSTPLVAGIVDILGIVIYVNLAILLMG
ncbi:magnesium transporter [Mariniblastus sp.]|nr:magnesium transporter [Mariniblastus sp.]